MIVSKFGGSSLANTAQCQKVIQIVRANPDRQIVVVSAPGERFKGDQRLTGQFELWWRLSEGRLIKTDEVSLNITARYEEIVSGLKIGPGAFSLEKEMEIISQRIAGGASLDFVMSRGEYLSARIMALALGYEFVDAAGRLFLDEQGHWDPRDDRLHNALAGRRAVFPGYYGSTSEGEIKVLPRGGSDISASIVAQAVGASRSENWTDVHGVRMAHPNIVKDPKGIRRLTYRQLRELSYGGAKVFHHDAALPVEQAGITTHILNTNDPDGQGTLVVPENSASSSEGIIGIAGRQDFTVLTVTLDGMNDQVGYACQILQALQRLGISLEHMPTGIDSLSLVIDDRQLTGNKLQLLKGQILALCPPDKVRIRRGIALITVVAGRISKPGVTAATFQALAAEGIDVHAISQGTNETSLIIAVDCENYEAATRAIYAALVK